MWVDPEDFNRFHERTTCMERQFAPGPKFRVMLYAFEFVRFYGGSQCRSDRECFAVGSRAAKMMNHDRDTRHRALIGRLARLSVFRASKNQYLSDCLCA